MFYNNTSLLRVPYSVVANEDSLAFLMNYLEKNTGSFDQIVFFTHATHDIRNISHMEEVAKTLAPILKKLKVIGYKVGVNILSTTGHHEETKDSLLDDMDFQQYEKDEFNRGRLCPSSEKNLEYIKQLYQVFAKLDIDIIYSDDDIDYATLDCKCSRCLNKFEDKYHNFKKNNQEISIEGFNNLLNNFGEEISDKMRQDWYNFSQEKILGIVTVIEKAVHGINENISIGYMSCMFLKDKASVLNMAKAYSMTSEMKWRPGGGLYTDKYPNQVTKKAIDIARQINFLPLSVKEIQSEIENFPYQEFKKSVKFTTFEALVYLLIGSTGTAYNVLPWIHSSLKDYEKYLDIAKNIKEFGDIIVESFGRNKLKGIGSYFTDKLYYKNYKSSPYEDEMINIGLPISYNNEDISVKIINKVVAEYLSETEILSLLKGAIYIDVNALEIFNARGYGKYTGFIKEKEYKKGVKEQNIKNFINDNEYERNICLEFSVNGHSEFEKADYAYSLKKSDSEAEYLTKLVDYNGNFISYGSGIFENELGGRVYVGGYAPFNWCYSATRINQIKNTMLWLSRKMLETYVVTPSKVSIICRNDNNIRLGIINESLDNYENIEIAIRNFDKNLTYIFLQNGKIEKRQLSFIKKDKVYSIYKIEAMPALSVGILLGEN